MGGEGTEKKGRGGKAMGKGGRMDRIRRYGTLPP